MVGVRLNKSECPIGIDVGAHGVRLLQLAVRGGKQVAVAAAYSPLSAGVKPADGQAYHDAVAQAVQDGLDRAGFTTNKVVSTLPASEVQCKNLRLPKMPADELAAAVEWEGADRLRLGKGQASVQFLDAGEVRQGDELRQEVVLLAAKLAFVEGHVDTLTSNSLRPVAIDAVSTALARRITALNTDTDSSLSEVWIDAGHNSTKVLIVRNGQVLFYKPIEIGGAALDIALAGELKISPERSQAEREAWVELPGDVDPDGEAVGPQNAPSEQALEAIRPRLNELGREIGLCLRYYGVTFRGPRPGQAVLVGGNATAWMAELLGEAMGLSLTIGNPLADVDLSAVRDLIAPGQEIAWGVAAGLSLRQRHDVKANTPATDTKEVAA